MVYTSVLSLNKVILESIDGLTVGVRVAAKINNDACTTPLKKAVITWNTGENAVTTMLTPNSRTMNQVFTHTYGTIGTTAKAVQIKIYMLVPAIPEIPAIPEHNGIPEVPAVPAVPETEVLDTTYNVKIPLVYEHVSPVIQSFSVPAIEDYLALEDPEDYEAEAVVTTMTAVINTGEKGTFLYRIFATSIIDGAIDDDEWMEFVQENEIVEVTKEFSFDDLSESTVKIWAFDPRGFFDTATLGAESLQVLPSLSAALGYGTHVTINKPSCGSLTIRGASIE